MTLRSLFCAVIAFVIFATGLCAQTYSVIATFNGTNGSGAQDVGSIVQGADGSFYGTTRQGGTNGHGTVFKVSPNGTITSLHSFVITDGSTPYAGLVKGADGNFYGTTAGGGGTLYSSGTAFKVAPDGTFTTIHTFDMPDASLVSYGGLAAGSDGNLYGTAQNSGMGGEGAIYKITPAGTVTTLYTFYTPLTQGANPTCALIQGSDGNFYGVTVAGGTASTPSGTVFKITPSGALTTLYNFGGIDGAGPRGRLVQGTDGNFYGTTSSGGANGHGTIFKLTPSGTLTTLYSFCPQPGCPDGSGVDAGLLQAADGNFYGTTSQDGANREGTIYKIAPDGTFTKLWDFCAMRGCPDGGGALSGLIQGMDGNLYGVTDGGGTGSNGVLFEFSLSSASSNSPSISQTGGVINAGSYQAGIPAGSWFTIKGSNLSSVTGDWTNAIVGGALPTSLDGVKVSVGGQPAYINYVSPTQINAIAPNVGTGTVPVTVTNAYGTSQAVMVTAATYQPAFFQWGNYAVATRQDFSLAVKNGTFPGVTTVPAKPGDVIILWGTGFGPTNPAAPSGVEVPADATYNTASTVTVTVGGMPATVYGAALAAGYAGLYQVAIQIPPSLSNGDYAVIATVSNTSSPSTTMITVQN